MQCLNNYGVQGSYEVPECYQMAQYFQECLKINKYFGLQKRWNPEHFAENEYSRERNSLSDIGLWYQEQSIKYITKVIYEIFKSINKFANIVIAGKRSHLSSISH